MIVGVCAVFVEYRFNVISNAKLFVLLILVELMTITVSILFS